MPRYILDEAYIAACSLAERNTTHSKEYTSIYLENAQDTLYFEKAIAELGALSNKAYIPYGIRRPDASLLHQLQIYGMVQFDSVGNMGNIYFEQASALIETLTSMTVAMGFLIKLKKPDPLPLDALFAVYPDR